MNLQKENFLVDLYFNVVEKHSNGWEKPGMEKHVPPTWSKNSISILNTDLVMIPGNMTSQRQTTSLVWGMVAEKCPLTLAVNITSLWNTAWAAG
jgi:hypothetical protein